MNSSGPFTSKVTASIVLYSLLTGLGLSWLYTFIIVPLVTTPFQGTIQQDASVFFDLLIIGLVLVAVVHNGLDIVSKAARRLAKIQSGIRVNRFTLNQRIQHIVMVVSMLLLALTGFSQVYFEYWGKVFIAAVGGLQVNMGLHLVSAIVLGALTFYHLAFYGIQYFARRATGNPVSLDITVSRKDFSDFGTNIKQYLGRADHPKYDKYNYAQKFDYWSIYWGTLVLGVPGVLLWAYGNSALGGLPYIFHVKEATLAVFWLVLFHMYHGHFNPRDFPMNNVFLTGTLSEQEMIEDHPLQLERIRTGGGRA